MSPTRLLVAPIVLAFAVIGLFALQLGVRAATPSPSPYPIVPGPPPRVALGVTTAPFAANAYRAWRERDLGEINAFEQRAQQHMGIVMWFADWEHSEFDPGQARAIARRKSIPEISWEPWDAAIGPYRDQADYELDDIIAGRYDAYVKRFARAAARYGGPLRLRFAQEMNGRWYPWAERANNNRPGEFIQAWRHVHGIFSGAGAKNVTWIWAPVAGRITRDQYPGDHVVDVIGLSGFNGGSALYNRGWRSFAESFGDALQDVARLFGDKPVEISEVASTEQGGDKAGWIRGMFAELARRPTIESVIWFDLHKESDWRTESSAAAQRAYRDGARALRAAGA